jgi:hypothetical protein
MPRPMSFEAFISSHSSKGRDGFIETARLVAGESPPQWLAKHFQRWSSSVMLNGNVHTKQLGKAEARVRLKALSEAAELVGRELQDPVVFELLLAEEFGPMPNLAGIDSVLEEIRRRADETSSRLNLLGTGLDERLEDLSDATKLVAREFRDPALSEFLRAEQKIGPPSPTIELGALLKEIRRQADAALLSPYLANEAGKTKAGASRALPPMASTPRAFCAAVILEAWAHFHNGEYPPASNLKLAAAAKEYWLACGGMADDGWGNNKLLAWRPYFEEALEPSLARIRKELRRHITNKSSKR